MAYKMKGHSLPGPNQRKSPAKKAGIYESTFDIDGNETYKRVSREQANKSEKLISETGKDITGTSKRDIQMRNAKNVRDLETGKTISSKEDQQKQKKTKSPATSKSNYSKGAQNLLKAVPNEEAYNKLSDIDKKGFDKASKKAGLPQKKSPAKQGLILDKRTKEQKAKDQKSKELWDKTVNIDDVPGVGGKKSKMQKQMEGRKTDMKKKKSPAKCPLVAALAPMAIKAVAGSMKKKEE